MNLGKGNNPNPSFGRRSSTLIMCATTHNYEYPNRNRLSTPAHFRTRLSNLQGILAREFSSDTREMAKMIADDFNEAYRDYLEVKINSKSQFYELKEIFSQQSD